jgi:flagellin-like hook-associated protein FlgL
MAMNDVTLTSSVRQSLLSLQNTQDLVSKTQKRLSSGLEVESAVDDAIAFFQSKSLLDRGADLLEKKDNIDQGVSTVSTALDAVTAIESIVNQMKGIANSMKSATASQMSSLVTTFNELHTQINNVAGDATYQGLNLVNGTGSTLAVEFSELTASSMDITSVDLRAKDSRTQFSDTRLGLALSNVATYTSDSVFSISKAATAQTNAGGVLGSRYVSADDAFDVTWNGTGHTFYGGETIAFTYGTGATIDLVVQTETPLTVTNGGTINIDVVTSSTSLAATADAFYVGTATTSIVVLYAAVVISGGVFTAATVTTSVVDTFTFTYQGNVGLTLTTADNGISLGTGGTAAGYGDLS